jgi:hypothetical protein
MPARSASSACDHLRASLCVSTGLIAIFLSFMDIIVSLAGKRDNQKHRSDSIAIAAAMPSGWIFKEI